MLNRISSTKEIIEVKERHLTKTEAINKAIILFNDEKYWWSHEALEMVWKEALGSGKAITQWININLCCLCSLSKK